MIRKKIVVIGGGTGTFTVLSGLKKYPFDLAAVVSMADDGGSTGILRDELGVLPPGDVRQCLVALSTSDKLMRDLMNYRFAEGKLKGHSFGNLLLSALEKITGGFDSAVEKASEILRLEGKVIPATLDNVSLVAQLEGNKIIKGQSHIHKTDLRKLKKISLAPEAEANSQALKTLGEADAIVFGPGDFYSSLVPNLLVRGISRAILESPAKKIYVCNLMAKKEHTRDFQVSDFTEKIEFYLGGKFDYIIYNNKKPDRELIKKYAGEGHPVEARNISESRFRGADLISKKIIRQSKGDNLLKRNLIRHDSDRLAKVIVDILRER